MLIWLRHYLSQRNQRLFFVYWICCLSCLLVPIIAVLIGCPRRFYLIRSLTNYWCHCLPKELQKNVSGIFSFMLMVVMTLPFYILVFVELLPSLIGERPYLLWSLIQVDWFSLGFVLCYFDYFEKRKIELECNYCFSWFV